MLKMMILKYKYKKTECNRSVAGFGMASKMASGLFEALKLVWYSDANQILHRSIIRQLSAILIPENVRF